MITVHLPVHLSGQFHADPVLTVAGTTCAELLQSLDDRYPGMAMWLAEPDGCFRQNLSVFVSGRRLASRTDTSEPLIDGSEVWILHAISGG